MMKNRLLLACFISFTFYGTQAPAIDQETVLNPPALTDEKDSSDLSTIENCANIDMMEIQSGSSCKGNSGRIYTKTPQNNLLTSDSSEWISPVKGVCLNYDQADNYCQNMGAKLPSIDQLQILKDDFMDPQTQKMSIMFSVDKTCCKLDMWVWVLSFSDRDALKTIWDLKDAHFGGYWGEYKHSTVCKK